MRGSVSARLIVWFPSRSRAAKPAASSSSGSSPPGSCSASAASPRTTCSFARFFLLASVSRSAPPGKSKAASPMRPGIFAPAFFHCSRPAIIRCSTKKSSPSKAKTIRFPSRRSPSTRAPTASLGRGSTVRRRKGLFRRTPSSGSPRTRERRACR